MKPTTLIPLALLLAAPAAAQNDKPPASAAEIVDHAPATDWVDIAPENLMIMTLAPDAKGKPRQVIIQLMAEPFSQPWVRNIRKLIAARSFDNIAVYRVQDNYVTQWGDPFGDEPDKARPLPSDLVETSEQAYVFGDSPDPAYCGHRVCPLANLPLSNVRTSSPYSQTDSFVAGWPVGLSGNEAWPVHCYGAVGVARGARPDAGDGTALYTVIGHAPRHLDRNIAIAGRVVEGMEFLSSLPRGTGRLGFYEDEADLVPIQSVRLASELPDAERPHLQFLSTESESFTAYAEARANRREDFFLVPAGGADICNIPVPIRRAP